ncbi:hypothetical protein [Brevibacillus brevis]|uniref:hypothetical protein n=1 Tax=Brevibacillus brevis TaxID=1393 RepID=UPI0025A61696|nr:hypothetical protein [Brevibacillus brevis]WJQ79833.1 hypothetical protein QN310_20410 [Brevibacillus brevis]
MDHNEFLLWEQTTRDCIDVKKIYVDLADDLIAGILLSQIVYWFLPNKKGKTKLRVVKDGHLWLAKGREDWWDECRIKARQFDTAFKKLEQQGLVEKRTYKYNGDPTIHIRILWDNFLAQVHLLLNQIDVTNVSEQEEESSQLTSLETVGYYGMVKTKIHDRNPVITDFNRSVKSESLLSESVLSNSVRTLTENTNIEFKNQREREEEKASSAAVLYGDSSELFPEKVLEREYELLLKITRRVFGMPKADEIDTIQLWNRWQEQFPQYDLTHIYAVLHATQRTARKRDDVMGIVMKRLPHAKINLIPIKVRAMEFIAQLRREAQ